MRKSISIRLFLTCWLVYGCHFATNTVREIFPALSLADNGSFDVTAYQGLHPDIFEMPGRGFFINNNPGASILGALPYFLAKPITDRIIDDVRKQREQAQLRGVDPPTLDSPWPEAREFYRQSYKRGMDIKFGIGAGLMQAGLMAPLSALCVVVMFRVLFSLTQSLRTALWFSVLYAFATPIFYRTGQLNHNLLVMHCAFFAWVLLWLPGANTHHTSRPWYFLAGLLCGWAVVCDYSGLIVPVVIGVYGLLHRRTLPDSARSSTDALRFVVGVAICGLILMAYQWSCFGHPLYPAQHYMPDAHFTERGYQGFSAPQWDLLWATAFDGRYGLFVSGPLLILALFMPSWSAKRRLVGRLEFQTILAFCLAFFLFCSANQYGRMQFNTGVRHVIPVTPFLFLLVAGTLKQWPRWLGIIVSVSATLWSWCLAMDRNIELGPNGVLDTIIATCTRGVQFPWLVTIHRLSISLPGPLQYALSPWFILVVLVVAITLVWTVGRGSEKVVDSVSDHPQKKTEA